MDKVLDYLLQEVQEVLILVAALEVVVKTSIKVMWVDQAMAVLAL
tara:strand:+ start:819 stop:953 length:135 start_codon:yes stop_codon:yes gene_type:complete